MADIDKRIQAASSGLDSTSDSVRMSALDDLLEVAEMVRSGHGGARTLQDCVSILCHEARRTHDNLLRQRIVGEVAENLRVSEGESIPPWSGLYFDLRELTVNGEDWDFSRTVVDRGTGLHFDLGVFSQCSLRFDNAKVGERGSIFFGAAEFRDTRIDFTALDQSGGTLFFRKARFESTILRFDGARLRRGEIGFPYSSIDAGSKIVFDRPASELYVAVRGAVVSPEATVCLPWVGGDERMCIVHRSEDPLISEHWLGVKYVPPHPLG